MGVTVLQWCAGGQLEPWFRAGVTHLADDRWTMAHGHDFVECLWVDDGHLDHDCDGRTTRLEVGDLVFVTDRQWHRFRGPASFTTCSLPLASALRLRQQYGWHHQPWPWDDAGLRVSLTAGRLAQAREWARVVPHRGQQETDAHWFFLGLLRLLRSPEEDAQLPWPQWLRRAVDALDDPVLLQLGVPALVRLCGRDKAHVSRVVRRVAGITPTELVNGLRLEQAARALRFSRHSILDIALDCGFVNQTHFHRLFRLRFGTTPLRFRQRRW